MKGGPGVLDQSKIIDSSGSSMAQLSVLECVELLAPLVASLGHQEASSFLAMAQAMGAGEATVGTAAFRRAAEPRGIAAWGLEGLRGSLHSRGSKVFLPALREQGTGVTQPPTAQQEQAEILADQQEVTKPRDDRQEATAAPGAGTSAEKDQGFVIAQLRARLAAAEASCEVGKTVPVTGPGASGATAAPVGTPTAAQRSAANDALRQEENKKFVNLVQTMDVPRELQLKLDAVLETMRDASVKLDWFHLQNRLTEAMQRASDLSLLEERKVLGDMIARGSQLQLVFYNATAVLGLFSRMLSSIHGVSQEVAEADMAEMRKLNIHTRNQFSVLGAAGYAGRTPTGGAYGGATLAGGGGRSSGRKPSPGTTPARSRYGNAFPAANAPARTAPTARSTAGYYGPQLARTGAGRGGRGLDGGGGGRGAAALSQAEKAAIRAQKAAQHSAVQQQQLNAPGNPNGLDVCKNCARIERDQFHSDLTCAWQVCMHCKLSGHRRAACTNDFGPDV